MNGIIVGAFALFLSSHVWAYTFDASVAPATQKQMADDLAFVDTITSNDTSKLHNSIFGKVQGSDYTHFFESRITSIGSHNCGSPNAVACVIPILSSSKMWITPNFTQFSHPQIARLMVVFHEARHTEIKNRFWSHASCPKPFKDAAGEDIKSLWTGAVLAGEPACDITPFGSYGSSLIMLKNISKYCTNCTAKVKMDAGIYADDQLKRIIDPQAKSAIKNDLYVTFRWASWPTNFAW
jgi:hypothetical protein